MGAECTLAATQTVPSVSSCQPVGLLPGQVRECDSPSECRNDKGVSLQVLRLQC